MSHEALKFAGVVILDSLDGVAHPHPAGVPDKPRRRQKNRQGCIRPLLVLPSSFMAAAAGAVGAGSVM